jgi:hypothetical protein
MRRSGSLIIPECVLDRDILRSVSFFISSSMGCVYIFYAVLAAARVHMVAIFCNLSRRESGLEVSFVEVRGAKGRSSYWPCVDGQKYDFVNQTA